MKNSAYQIFICAFVLFESINAQFQWEYCDLQYQDCNQDQICSNQVNKNATNCFNVSPLIPLFDKKPNQILTESITLPCLQTYQKYASSNIPYQILLNCSATLFPDSQCGKESKACILDNYCATVLSGCTACLNSGYFFGHQDYDESEFFNQTYNCINNNTNATANTNTNWTGLTTCISNLNNTQPSPTPSPIPSSGNDTGSSNSSTDTSSSTSESSSGVTPTPSSSTNSNIIMISIAANIMFILLLSFIMVL